MEWTDAAFVFAAYLFGAIPFGYLLVRLRSGADIRETGSGSTGATNVARASGPAWALLVLVLDFAKGYGAVWLTDWFTEANILAVAAASLAAVVGHSYPVFLRFRGGKSVAVGLGVFFYLFPPLYQPWAIPVGVGVWVAAIVIWRYVSLASILAAAALPALVYASYSPSVEILAATVACCCVIILRHRGNIERLIAGNEPKFKLKYQN